MAELNELDLELASLLEWLDCFRALMARRHPEAHPALVDPTQPSPWQVMVAASREELTS